ncbi:MAG: hypothetical protein K2X99_10540 [Gemmatimonadaceae bacterium]|nr:hypothetical protein [Gemmatimonadaceae bacterium]
MSESAVVTIDRIATGGDGVGRLDGMVVFTPRTAPGDRVRVRLRRERRFARGIVEQVEAAGPDRITAPCPSYDGAACGGCQLQHLTLDAQRAAKQMMIVDAFARIARRTIPLPPMATVGAPWGYRLKLTMELRRAGSRYIAGLHRFDAPDTLVPFDDCAITDPRVLAVWRAILDVSIQLPHAPSLRASVRVDGDDVLVHVEGARTWNTLAEFADALPQVAAIWWTPEQGGRRVVIERRAAAHPGASFAQVNAAVGAAMHAEVLAAVRAAAPRTLLDAYSGTGALAIACAGDGVRVTAVELDPDATAWAAAHLPPPSRAIAARVEDVIHSHLPADVVVVNPPRAGVDAAVTTALDRAVGVKRLVYVSCDPATLARDVGRLPHWRVETVQAFDMFPQTAHVETVAVLTPEGAA